MSAEANISALPVRYARPRICRGPIWLTYTAEALRRRAIGAAAANQLEVTWMRGIGLRASFLLMAVASTAIPVLARSDPVQILAAGSLRGVVADLTAAGTAVGIEVRSDFGGSGLLRERIE